MDKVIGSVGGKKRAEIQRNEAIRKYEANPNYCLQCGSVITIPEGWKVPWVRKKKFCNRSCAAKYNSKKPRKKKKRECLKCGKDLPLNCSYKREYCIECEQIVRAESSSSRQLKDKFNKRESRVDFCTKKELFEKRSNYQSARSSIRVQASKIYKNSDRPKKCEICGYDKVFEVCHRKSVSDFSDDSLILDINSLDNLIALCPNCHWEFDHNLLKI